jgi:hypothetical protein
MQCAGPRPLQWKGFASYGPSTSYRSSQDDIVSGFGEIQTAPLPACFRETSFCRISFWGWAPQRVCLRAAHITPGMNQQQCRRPRL